MDRPSPSDYTPALGWWGHTWRVLAAGSIGVLVWSQALLSERDHHAWLLGVDTGLGVVALVLMFFRRRWPVPVAVATALMSMVSGLAAGPALLASVSLATRRVVWQVAVVGVLSVAAGVTFNEVAPQQSPTPWLLNLGLAVAITVAVLALGMYIGSRRELLWSLRERARAAEAEQELRVDAARGAERERIAREMHDVLAHRISMVSMHAGALAFRTDLPAEQVQETAELIQRTSHEALTDLRQVLGTLRDGTGTHGDRPQPRLDDLPAMVEEARQGGMAVDLELDLDTGAAVPEAVGRTVYRLVQEGLTNAHKHATGCRVSVRVGGRPGPGLEVRVENGTPVGASARGPAVPGAGLGLVGLRERAELVGGRVEARRGGGRFVLQGWLPWPG